MFAAICWLVEATDCSYLDCKALSHHYCQLLLLHGPFCTSVLLLHIQCIFSLNRDHTFEQILISEFRKLKKNTAMQINYTFHWPMKTENFDLSLRESCIHNLQRKAFSAWVEIKWVVVLSWNMTKFISINKSEKTCFVFYWERQCCQLFTDLLYD